MRSCSVIAKVIAISSITALLVSVSEASESVVATTQSLCEPRILRTPTQFPERAQNSGAAGEVHVKVLLGERRVLESRVARSSGYGILDRAAVRSVLEDWEFDVSHCNASSLPISTVVSVHYIRVPVSVSFGVERRGIASATTWGTHDRCTVAPTSRKNQSIACIQ